MVMLGGRHKNAFTEVHDVVMAVGSSLEDVYPQLKQAWFAESKGLHIDAWSEIHGVSHEGQHYQIQFSNTQPRPSDLKLYLINLGGYHPDQFGELHRYSLVVAENPAMAKRYGKAQFAEQWQKQHVDAVIDVDDCFEIDQIQGRYVYLVEADYQPTYWENCYIVLS